ncbi:hypothetical protein BB560_000072 [Smittium megazygosporum]|uniref:Uncharacterized protein n=1 Tax=Smittium megazygosporum TaxID=133381 RepID=A0A2T9ZLE4_9FUNG|nr:hypothetical protein BB560_000072 [Smittium megazygosporum]
MNSVYLSAEGLSDYLTSDDKSQLRMVADPDSLQSSDFYSSLLDIPSSIFALFLNYVAAANQPQSIEKSDNADATLLAAVICALLTKLTMLTKLSPKDASAYLTQLKETENLKALWGVEKAKLEQAVHEAETQTSVLNRQLENTKKELNSLKDQKDQFSNQVTKLTKANEQLLVRSSELENLNQNLKASNKNLQDEKMELMSQLADRRNHLDSANSENEFHKKSISELRSKITTYEQEIEKLRSTQSTFDVKEVLLQNNLQSSQKQILALSSDLETAQSKILEINRNYTTEKLALKSKIQTAEDELSATKTQLSAVQSDLSKTRTQLEAKTTQVSDLSQQLLSQEAQFKEEMSAQKRLTEVWENTANQTKERLLQIEAAVDTIDKNRDAERQKYKAAFDKADEEISHWQSMAHALEEKCKSLESQQSEFRKVFGEIEIDHQLLSPSVKAESALHRSKVSLSELWARNMSLDDQLINEKDERKKLQETLQEVLDELEERAPIIAAEREQYEQQKKLLSELMSERERFEENQSVLESSISEQKSLLSKLEKELQFVNRENSDLSVQVRKLLRMIEELRNNGQRIPDGGENDSEIENDNEILNESETNQIISENLVTFRDIKELQSQNRKLLRALRELASKVEEQELARQEEWNIIETEALQSAKDTIEQLTQQIKNLKSKNKALQTEKEILQKMKPSEFSSLKDSNTNIIDNYPTSIVDSDHLITQASNGDMPSIEKQFEEYKNESLLTRDQLKSDLDFHFKENSKLRISLSQCQAHLDLIKQQLLQQQQDYSYKASELDSLRLSNSRLVSQIESYEKQLDATASKNDQLLMSLESSNRRLAVVGAERDVLRKSEAQWKEEMSRWSQERESLTRVLENTTKMRDEWRELADVKVKDLEKQLLEAQTSILKEKQNSEKWERMWIVSDQQRTAFHNEMRANLDAAKNELKSSQSQLKEKEGELGIAVEKNKTLLDENSSLQLELNEFKRSQEEEEKELQKHKLISPDISLEVVQRKQIKELKLEIDKSQKTAQTWEQRAAMFKEMANGLEVSLEDLKATYQEFKDSSQATISKLETQVAEYQDTEKNNVNEIANLKEHNKKLEDESADQKTQIEKLKSDYATLEEQFKTSVSTLQEELYRQKNISMESQDLYQKELIVHAKQVEASLALRAQITELKNNIESLKSQLAQTEGEKVGLESELKTERDLSKAKISGLEERSKQLERQNDVLLTTLGVSSVESIINGYSSKADGGSNLNEGESNFEGGQINVENVSALGEVVMFQKQERDVAIARAEALSYEVDRLKAQLERTQKQLDDSRMELSKFTEEQQPSSIDNIRAGIIHLTESQEIEWKERLNEASILRESNSSLRQQLSSMSAEVTRLENGVATLRENYNSQSLNFISITSELDQRKREIQILEESNASWQKRNEQILAKYQRIDPVEHEELKVKAEELQTTCDSLKDDLAKTTQQLVETQKSTKENEDRAVLAAKTQFEGETNKLRLSFNSQQERLKLQIAEHQNAALKLNNQIAHLESELKRSKELVSSLEATIAEKNKQLLSLQNVSVFDKNTIDNLKKEKAEVEANLETKNSKNELWKSRFDLLRKQSIEKLSLRSEKINELREIIKNLTGSYPEDSATPEKNLVSTLNQASHTSENEAQDVHTGNGESEPSSANTAAKDTKEHEELVKKYQFVSEQLKQLRVENHKLQQENVALGQKVELAANVVDNNNGVGQVSETATLEPGEETIFSDSGSSFEKVQQLQDEVNALNKKLEDASKSLAESAEVYDKYNAINLKYEELVIRCDEYEAKLKQAELQRDELVTQLEKFKKDAYDKDEVNKAQIVVSIDKSLQTDFEFTDFSNTVSQDQSLKDHTASGEKTLPSENITEYLDKIHSLELEKNKLNEEISALQKQVEDLENLHKQATINWENEKEQLGLSIKESKSLYESLKEKQALDSKKSAEFLSQIAQLQAELGIAKNSVAGDETKLGISGTADKSNTLSAEQADQIVREAVDTARSEEKNKFNLTLADSIERAKKESEMRMKIQLSMAERKATLYSERIKQLEKMISELRNSAANSPKVVPVPATPQGAGVTSSSSTPQGPLANTKLQLSSDTGSNASKSLGPSADISASSITAQTQSNTGVKDESGKEGSGASKAVLTSSELIRQSFLKAQEASKMPVKETENPLKRENPNAGEETEINDSKKPKN